MADAPSGRLGPISGRHGDVAVTLTNVSFGQAPKGRVFPYRDFGPDFIDVLHKALVGPERRGFLRSTLVCPWCSASLDGVVRKVVSVNTDIELATIPPIRVDLEMPGMTCSACGRAMVMIDDRRVDSDLSDALIDAFNSAGLTPD